MEFIITAAASAFIGYMVNKLERMESKIDAIEIEVVILKTLLPKRKEDVDSTLSR